MITFTKAPENPIYGGSETGTLFDVYVTKVDGRYRMDFSWRTQKALAVSFSDDGIHWNQPQITLAYNKDSGWEDSVNRNCVLQADGKYKMWYTGQARGYSYIGYAESENGLNFKRVRREPVLIFERYWEGMSVMNPCVRYEDGKYKMWYAAGETYEPNIIAYAESVDGIVWNKVSINPIFVRNGQNSYEQNRVGGCQILRHDQLGYLMFYIGYKDVHTACICAAASPNGVTQWKRCISNPLIQPDAGSWDQDSCYKPSAYFEKDRGIWRIWYNGRHQTDEYIGTATASGDFSHQDFA